MKRQEKTVRAPQAARGTHMMSALNTSRQMAGSEKSKESYSKEKTNAYHGYIRLAR